MIHVRAEDSPNVRYALAQIAKGIEPTDEVLVPGILTWGEYKFRRATWDKVRQCIGLDGRFYEGAEVLLYPPEWLTRAGEVSRGLVGRPRKVEAIGVDTGEGGDLTTMVAVDRLGIVDATGKKTPDTAVITGDAIAFMRKHNVKPDHVMFDAGGGGKQHADRLRDQGYPVRVMRFGAPPSLDPKRGLTLIEERKEMSEMRYVYKDMRTEMFHLLSQQVDPAENPQGFGIPVELQTLREELAPIPKLVDDEGRFWLPSKGTVTDDMKKRNIPTLRDIIGHSPDWADAAVMAVWRMLHAPMKAKAGAAFSYG